MAHFGRVNTSTRCMSPMPRHLPRAFGLPSFLAHTSHTPQVVPRPAPAGRGRPRRRLLLLLRRRR